MDLLPVEFHLQMSLKTMSVGYLKIQLVAINLITMLAFMDGEKLQMVKNIGTL
jgi:hypothetical protein